MAIEVGQLVLGCPLPDVGFVAIRTAITIATATVPLLQEPLVLPLEFVIQHHALHPRAALLEPGGLAFVRAKDLHVVLDFAGLLQIRVKGLLQLGVAAARARIATVAVTPMGVKKAASAVGQDKGDVAVSVHVNGTNQALLAQVTKVTAAGIEGPAVVVA